MSFGMVRFHGTRKMWRALFLASILGIFSTGAAAYQSTINPLLPVQNAPLASAVVRGNFQSAYNDINNIYGLLPGPNSLAFAAIPLTVNLGGTGLSTFGGANTCLKVNGSATALAYGSCIAGAGTVTSVTFTGDGLILSSTPSSAVTVSGTLTATAATQTANTVIGATGTSLSALSVPSCSASTNALTWTSGTGFGCHTVGLGTGSVSSVATGTGLTGGPITSSGTISIAATTVATGSYGSATTSPTYTVNAQGQLTAAANVTITPTWGSITNTPTTLAGYGIASPLPVAQGGTAATSQTSNGVAYYNGSIITTGLGLTYSGGDLGIGTASPSTSLQVIGTATATTFSGSGASLTNIGTSNMTAVAGTANSTTFLRGDNTWGAATGSGIAGSGVSNYVARWIGTVSIGTGVLYDNGTSVGIGSTSPQVSLDMSQKTDAIAIPVGTTGQRSAAALGMVRFNSSIADEEIFIGTSVGTGGWAFNSTGGSLDPTTFGAQCNGTTNDINALNAAVTYLTNPGSILLPANKVCGIGNAVVLSIANQIWDGQGSTLKILSGSNSGIGITANGVTVMRQYMNGNSSGGTGIFVQGTYDVVSNSNIQSTAVHGIVADGQSSSCGYNRFTNNTVGNVGSVGMGANDCQHVSFSGNLVYNSANEGNNLDNLSHYGRILNFDLIGNNGGTGGIGQSNSNYTVVGDGSILNQGNSLPAISVNNQGGTSVGGMIHDVAMVGNTGCVLLGTFGSFFTQNFVVHGTSCDGTGYALSIGTGSSNNLYYGNNTGGGAIIDNGTHDIIYGNTGTGTFSFNVNVGGTFGASYLNIAAPSNGLIVQGVVGIGTSSVFDQFNVRTVQNGVFDVAHDTSMGSPTVVVKTVNDTNSADEPWRLEASQYYFSIGGVGIGAASIVNKLEVNGAASIGYTNIAAPTNGLAVLGATGIGTTSVFDQFNIRTVANGILDVAHDTSLGNPTVVTKTVNDLNSVDEPWRLEASQYEFSIGNVGIGTAAVSFPLQVQGTISATQYDVSGTQIAASNLSNGTTGTGSIMLAASPTTTGTFTAAAAIFSGAVAVGASSVFDQFNVRPVANAVFDIGHDTSMGTPTLVAKAVNDTNSVDEPWRFEASQYDFSIGNVGIGTTSPNRLLEVSGNSVASDQGIRISYSTHPTTYYGELVQHWDGASSGFNYNFNIVDADTGYNATALAIKPNGNVGIGVTTPSFPLQINGTVSATQYDVSGTQIAASNLSNGTTGTGSVVLAAAPTFTGSPILATPSATSLGIGTASLGTNVNLAVNGGALIGSYANTKTATLSNGLYVSGNVGVGTSSLASSPSGAFEQVGNNAFIQNVVNSQALFSSNAYFNGAWSYYTAGTAGGVYYDGSLKLFNAPSGSAGGTITNFAGSDIAIIITNSSPPQIAIGTSSTGAGRITLGGITTGTNADFLCLAADLSVLLQTTPCTISQRKLKENFEIVQGDTAMKDILALNPQQFNFKPTKPANKDPNATATQFGFIAEEVAAVDPRLAVYEDDMKTPKSYRQDSMISILVKGMQTQQHEIDDLRAQLRLKPHACNAFCETREWLESL